MAFPPNYHQERSNRDRAKQRKADEKKARREEQAAQRKTAGLSEQDAATLDGGDKDAQNGKEENQG